MGICTSKKKKANIAFKNEINAHGDVWEVNLHNLQNYVKNNTISQKSLLTKPLMCNYIILEKSGNTVIRIKMEYKNGVYKKYPAYQYLGWHIRLTGMPASAAVLLKDKHLYKLYHSGRGI
jgi:hypothetical protein